MRTCLVVGMHGKAEPETGGHNLGAVGIEVYTGHQQSLLPDVVEALTERLPANAAFQPYLLLGARMAEHQGTEHIGPLTELWPQRSQRLGVDVDSGAEMGKRAIAPAWGGDAGGQRAGGAARSTASARQDQATGLREADQG